MNGAGASGGDDDNGDANASGGAVKHDLATILKIIKKYNFKKTEKLLVEEAHIDDLAELEKLNAASHDALQAPAGPNETELYALAYAALREFVENSPEMYKPELSMVLYPVLVQIYFKLMSDGHAKEARYLLEKHGAELDHYYRPSMQKLLLIKSKADMVDNDFVYAMEMDQFVIRMCGETFALFKAHIQDRKHKLIADIVGKYLFIETYEGPARTKEECDATAGSHIGEAKRQENRIRIYYGLLKEVDYVSLFASAAQEQGAAMHDFEKPKRRKPKKEQPLWKRSKFDPNAPANDRVPLPELRDADKLEKAKAAIEAGKYVPLNSETLPSVCMYTILNAYPSVTCVEVTDDSALMAIGFKNSSIKVLPLTPGKLREMKSPEQLQTLDKDSVDVYSRIMDENSGKSMRIFYGHSGPVYRCAFAPEQNVLLSCSADATIRLWSLQTWTCLVVYKGHLHAVWDVCFSPHGHYFATSSYDKTARMWSTDCHQPLRIFVGHLDDVDCVQFHPNSNYIATGSSDHTVRLWDIIDGELVRLLTGHKSAIYSLVFSRCGRYLVSGSSDHTAKVWNLSGGQLVASLERHSSTIHAMAFSRDGTVLAVGGLDCHLTLWDFAKMTEAHLQRKPRLATNAVVIDADPYLLRTYQSKSTPFLLLHFTRRNLLFTFGTHKPNQR